MKWGRMGLVVYLALLMLSSGVVRSESSETQPPTETVVMVCEHGTVKSLIAASLFDREASKRGLELRALSRGVVPDEEVPNKIALALVGDGFDLSDFRPAKLTANEVATSVRVVAIGSDLSQFESGANTMIEQWNDIPPASVDYEAAKAALLARVEALLDELEASAETADAL